MFNPLAEKRTMVLAFYSLCTQKKYMRLARPGPSTTATHSAFPTRSQGLQTLTPLLSQGLPTGCSFYLDSIFWLATHCTLKEVSLEAEV